MAKLIIRATTLFFSVPSFKKGASRLMDLTGSLDEYNSQPDADYQALKKDWGNVGFVIKTKE
ncbi:MAG: hypothetical protein HYV34_01980 [Candidatus Kerfeldbacteria bacterium]|nr:hypothetical protein [Candidatus Kerfeldbacteria bacterium]